MVGATGVSMFSAAKRGLWCGAGLWFLLVWVSAPWAVAAQGAIQPQRVRLQLKWQHQFQFAGYYAALAKGYYREAGLEVEILPAVPGEDAAQKVLRGEAEYGVGTTDLLLLRQRGEPVVALAVIFQHSPLALLAKKRGGAQSVHDLAGQPVMIEPGSAELDAYLRREGMTPDRFRLLTHSAGTEDLVAGKVAAMSVYVTDEPFELRRKDVEYVLFSPRAGGIDFYGDNLFTTESELRAHPDRVKAFRAASLRGWEYAMAHPEELASLIHERYSARHSIEHLLFEAHQMAPLLQIDLVETGHMYAGRWRHIAEVYAELGMMKRDFDFGGFLYDAHPPPLDPRGLYLTVAGVLALATVLAGIALFVHRANRRLRASEGRYRAVYETAPLAFIVSNQDFVVVDWNQAAERIFGWSREEAVGKDIYRLLVPESDLEHVRQVVDATLSHEVPTHSINWNVTKAGGRILCEWNNVRRYDDDGRLIGVLSLGIDITARQQLEDGLRQSKEMAEQALDEHRQFLAMISHEFRSPLASIDAASQMLEMRCNGGDAAPEVARIRRAVQRLSLFLDNRLTENRLDTRAWALHAESFALPAFLDGVVDQARKISAAHPVRLEAGSVPPTFGGDPNLLRIMLRNLLENAVKYSPDGGEVVLTAGLDAAGRLRLAVTDHGLGILPEERERLFTRYFRGRQVGNISGAGLGLSLVKRIVQLHNGEIAVDSEPGRGTTISVSLPVG